MGDSERAVCKMESTFRMRNVGFVFNVYFIALYEKCDTTGQMKDIIATHAVKMVEFCAL